MTGPVEEHRVWLASVMRRWRKRVDDEVRQGEDVFRFCLAVSPWSEACQYPSQHFGPHSWEQR